MSRKKEISGRTLGSPWNTPLMGTRQPAGGYRGHLDFQVWAALIQYGCFESKLTECQTLEIRTGSLSSWTSCSRGQIETHELAESPWICEGTSRVCFCGGPVLRPATYCLLRSVMIP